MRLQSAAILHNPKKPSARRLKADIEGFLRERGVRVLKPSQAQVLIAISGDGTILYNKNRYGAPVLGIGSHTSQLCETRFWRWRADLARLLRHGFRLERRAMIEGRLDGHLLPLALNEVVVRNRHHRLLHLALKAGGKVHHFRCDGVIVATATGSRAYAYSAGGRKMPFGSKRMQVVAIAPHQREFKPLTLPADAVVRVWEERRRQKRPGKDSPGMPTKPDVVMDGQFMRPLKSGAVLEVRRARHEMAFVRILGKKGKR